ncbi:MAG: hypothetical protein HYZ14_14655 [Bacteroidetes bacterium]|nr:hypothetical protein [Bacteroidota bacterium]
MKILFSGLPYFGKKLVQELRETDSENTYLFCDTYYSKKDQLKFLFHLITAKKVVSFNGASSNSGSLNWALRFKKPLIMQWHGSDVLTLRTNKLGRNNSASKYTQQAKSFTDAVWLQQELQELGVEASILHFKHARPTTSTAPFQTANVVSYLAQNNELFYGIEAIQNLAFHFPQITFHLIGTDGNSMKHFPNIQYHGWVSKDKVTELMNANAIYLRLTAHDGYSLSVLEALANGNYVIWNNPHPCVNFVKDNSSLKLVFEKVLDQVKTAGYARVKANIDWVAEHHSKEKILRNYIRMLIHD